MSPNSSLRILMGAYRSLYVLIGPNLSVSVLMRLYGI